MHHAAILAAAAALAACVPPDTTSAESQGICIGSCGSACYVHPGLSDVCADLGGCTLDGQKSSNGHLVNPQIFRVYWGDPDSAYHETMWSTIAPSVDFWSRFAEYGTGTGRDRGGYWFTAPKFSDSILKGGVTYIRDSDIQTWLTNNFVAIDLENEFDPIAQPLDDKSNSAIFVIYLAPGTCNAWFKDCGHIYHNAFQDPTTKNLYVYAVVDPGPHDAASRQGGDRGATHEVTEAATDFDLGGATGCDGHSGGCGWNIEGQTEGELCDLCKGTPVQTVDGYSVYSVWSNANCLCQ